MSDAQAGRILVFILALIFSIWAIKDMSWKDKWHRFLLRFYGVTVLIEGICWLVFDVLVLFSLE